MRKWDGLVTAYVEARGEICIEAEVRCLLGREPEPEELESAMQAIRERGACVAPDDVVFFTEAEAEAEAARLGVAPTRRR
jgi:hypothetical protein